MRYFGKFLLGYLTEPKYRYNDFVIESCLLECADSLALYQEKVNQIDVRVSQFFNPNIDVDFILREEKKSEFFFVNMSAVSYFCILDEKDIINYPNKFTAQIQNYVIENKYVMFMPLIKSYYEGIVSKYLKEHKISFTSIIDRISKINSNSYDSRYISSNAQGALDSRYISSNAQGALDTCSLELERLVYDPAYATFFIQSACIFKNMRQPMQQISLDHLDYYDALIKFQKTLNTIFYNKRVSWWLIKRLNLNTYPLPYSIILIKSKLTTISDFMEIIKIVCREERPFVYRYLSSNINLNLNFVLENISQDWDWGLLSCNPAFSVQDILSTPELQWSHAQLSMHPKLDIKTVLKNPQIEWNYFYLSRNKNITIHDLEKLPIEIFKNLFSRNYIFQNPFWDRETFLKHHKKFSFSQQQIGTMFLAKKSWMRHVERKKKQLYLYYDELMAHTFKPDRLEAWIWDTDFIKEWNSTPMDD
jgi:hypothetical protein